MSEEVQDPLDWTVSVSICRAHWILNTVRGGPFTLLGGAVSSLLCLRAHSARSRDGFDCRRQRLLCHLHYVLNAIRRGYLPPTPFPVSSPQHRSYFSHDHADFRVRRRPPHKSCFPTPSLPFLPVSASSPSPKYFHRRTHIRRPRTTHPNTDRRHPPTATDCGPPFRWHTRRDRRV